MFWQPKKPTVDQDTVDWVVACWKWLDLALQPIDGQPRRRLVVPSRSNFPDTELTGPAKAEYYFERVKHHCGMDDWPVSLRAQAATPDLGQSIVFAEMPSKTALGTFRTKGNQAIITYDPGQTGNPVQLIATFVHELAHYALTAALDAPPGGPELEELATDLATVHLGFGLFGANTAFAFEQSTDFDRQGWRSSSSGYLGENGWCFAVALFTEVLDLKASGYQAYAKPSVLAQIAKNRRYLAANPALVSALRSPGIASG